MDLKLGVIILLALVLTYGLYRGVRIDTENLKSPHRHKHESCVKKTIISCRDGAIRGFVMGLGGGLPAAVHGAITWGLVGGSATTVGDIFGWNTKLCP